MTGYLALAFLFGILLGQILGKWGEARIWRLKANPEARTAQHSGREFYYVIPEKEYVEKFL